METTSKDLWVFIETNKRGFAINIGQELLNPGRMLANKQGGELVAIIIGNDINNAIEQIMEFDVDKIIAVNGKEFEFYNTDIYVYAMHALIEKYKPLGMLIGSTNNGRDMGARLSCRLKTGLTADCTSIDIDEESGNIAWTRPAFGGNLMATILCPISRPQLGTVRAGVYKMPEKGKGNAVIIEENVSIPKTLERTKIIESIIEVADGVVDLQGAEIIVSGGRGVGGPEGFDVIKAFADAIGGTVGASRAAVDSGWISHAHQVGQTGKTVSPKLYFACGISGAIQHIAGMGGSDYIIAINKNKDAPIFRVANYGIVGDLFEVLPVLTKEILQRKATIKY